MLQGCASPKAQLAFKPHRGVPRVHLQRQTSLASTSSKMSPYDRARDAFSYFKDEPRVAFMENAGGSQVKQETRDAKLSAPHLRHQNVQLEPFMPLPNITGLHVSEST